MSGHLVSVSTETSFACTQLKRFPLGHLTQMAARFEGQYTFLVSAPLGAICPHNVPTDRLGVPFVPLGDRHRPKASPTVHNWLDIRIFMTNY